MTMVSQGSTQKPFVLDIASKVADLLNPQTRTFLKAKCEEFFRRIADIDARSWASNHECEVAIRHAESEDLAEFGCEKNYVIRYTDAGMEAIKYSEPDELHPWTDEERVKFIPCSTKGDPRHWFPPHAVWWKQPDAKEELPNEQDALVRDCVLAVLIHDLTFPRHKPVYFRPGHDYPGGKWWIETLWESLLAMKWVCDPNSPDVDHVKAFIRQSLGNVAEACGAQGLLAGRTKPRQAGEMQATNLYARRFTIALSFPGEHRDFVEKAASCLAGQIGRERVLYDRYHEAEFARPDLDVYLPNLYATESELIVIFLCPDYAKKRWCKLEW
jgi:hypothetical protein